MTASPSRCRKPAESSTPADKQFPRAIMSSDDGEARRNHGSNAPASPLQNTSSTDRERIAGADRVSRNAKSHMQRILVSDSREKKEELHR